MNKQALFLAVAIAAASPVEAAEFSCRNRAAEIRCEGGHCRPETDNFTPMQLTRVGNLLTLCAYSGCWEGRIGFSRSRSGVDFLQGTIRRLEPAGRADVSRLSVLVSRREQTAQISWNGFFSVLECGSLPSG